MNAILQAIIGLFSLLFGQRKAGQDAQTVADQQGVMNASNTRARADDAARRTDADRLRDSLKSDSQSTNG